MIILMVGLVFTIFGSIMLDMQGQYVNNTIDNSAIINFRLEYRTLHDQAKMDQQFHE